MGRLVDLREQLPAIGQYNTRPLDAIRGVTLHYTAGPANQTVQAIAAYQTSPAAAGQTGTGNPFPAIAYTIMITQNGDVNICHDLDERTWHSAATVAGLPRNLTHIGICYTGDTQPNAAQISGLAKAISWCEDELANALPGLPRRQLAFEGHKDAPYPTDCPGNVWDAWRGDVENALVAFRVVPPHDVANGFVVGAGFVDYLINHPEWGMARMDEIPIVGGAYLWTTPTPQHPKGGLLVYRSWLNSVRAVGWEAAPAAGAITTGDVRNGFAVGTGFENFLEIHAEMGKARTDELPLVGGSYLWTTTTAQHPKGGMLVYRSWLNSVQPVTWD